MDIREVEVVSTSSEAWSKAWSDQDNIKFGFEYLIFLIFLRFGAEFSNFLDFSFWSFFELGTFKNDAWAFQNDS